MADFVDFNVRYWNGDLFISCSEFNGSVGISGCGFQTNGQDGDEIIDIALRMLPLFEEMKEVVGL